MKMQAPAVAVRARELGLPLLQPARIRNEEALAEIARAAPHAGIVVAYGKILPAALLAIPRHGFLNVHGSILPRWRGAAPIQRAILAGDHVTGVTIMRMERGLDTGPMLATARVPIEDKTSGELHAELAEIGARLIVNTLAQLDQLKAEPQPEFGATYAVKIDKAEARIEWSKPAELIEREVRAFAPFPGSWLELGGERIKLLKARVIGVNGAPGTVLDSELTVACGDAAIRPLAVQRAGKPAMSGAEFLRGRPVQIGTVLR
jgi:methionyl-tRNA formyltransferase